jgi:tryptophanyl-tRNA synthetase
MGGELYIPLTDDESYVDGKVAKLSDGTKNAKEKIIPVLQKMGFDLGKTHYLIDTEQTELYQFAIELSRYVSMAELTHLFGAESLTNPGQVFYRGCVQLAEILMPQLPQNGGPRHTLIPVGIDQHPYILLARDVAKKIGMVPPSELVLRFFPSLADPEKKMSKSSPESAVFLDDAPEVVKRKIKKAFTGSVGSLEEHKKFGGVNWIS